MSSQRDVQDEQSSSGARYRMAAWVGAMVAIIAVALAVLLWSWFDTAVQ